VKTSSKVRTELEYLWLLELGQERFLFGRKLPERQLEKHFRETTSPAIYNEFYHNRLKQAKWNRVEIAKN
jgi:hypothetical protein